MSYLDHEESPENKCGCPACDLTDKYLKDYDAYKARQTYITISIHDDDDGTLEDRLNEAHSKGYELIMNAAGIIIMRSYPPDPPNVRDIVQEINRRREESGKEIDINAEDWANDIVGGLQ